MAGIEKSKEAKKFKKSYFDVLGICCSSEVPLIERILKPLDGIQDVNVIVPSRTVIVIHDDLLISQIQIVKALNQARLEANVRVYGEEKYGKKWPSPYTMACGLLLSISFLKYLFHAVKLLLLAEITKWFALAAVMVGLPPILFRSKAAIQNFTLDINILVMIAIGGTIALKDYTEAGVIVFLFTIAEWLESRASHKANAVMSSLMSVVPQKAVLAETGQVIDAKDVNVSTILAVKAGEVIPIDGIVVEGKCEIDEKTLTGESYPVTKQNQSNVWAGTINVNGYISVKTTALAEDCVVAKMAKLVEEAQNNKSKTQRFIDRCAKYYTPAVVITSAAFVAVPAAIGTHDIKRWGHLALVILVSACPCALVLSTPIAVFCAFTKAATTGILIKGGDFLEILAKIKIMAFDKTGTITRGEFLVMDFRSLRCDISLDTLLYWISSIESKSSHPMAAALIDYGHLNFIEPKPENVKEFKDFPGEGIYGEIDGKNIFIGNKKIAMRAGCETVPTLEGETEGGSTIGYIFSGATPIGIFSLADTCRSGVAEAINELKHLGIKTIMLTGDSNVAAMRAQDQLAHAIEVVHAELLPEEKVRIINDLKKNGPTAMIGDGVNDAPALATADIGISMGISGSALATETGHITLMSNDIRKIPQAIRLARETHWKIVQNVGLSILTKTAILTLAFWGHPLVWAAILADVGTCLLVIFNSMLLLRGTNEHRRRQKTNCAPHSGHSSCGGCKHVPHENDDCRLKDTVQQKCCAHGDTQNTYQHEEEQMCDSRNKCQSVHSSSCEKDGCGNSISMHNDCLGIKEFTHHNHNDHTSIAHNIDSHVIQISKIADGDGVRCGMSNHLNCSEKSDRHATHATCDHSLSVTRGTNHASERLESSKQDELSKTHHHHEHDHDHHHHHVQIKPTTGCLQNGDAHVGCKGQPMGFDDTCHERTNCTTGRSDKESKSIHVCGSLETREIGGCCESFRKECGGLHGCLGGGVGGLSEIITEQMSV